MEAETAGMCPQAWEAQAGWRPQKLEEARKFLTPLEGVWPPNTLILDLYHPGL